MNGFSKSAAAATICVLCSSALAVDVEVALVEAPGIPPGQERLLIEMLGKGSALPGGCEIGDGRVEVTTVEVTFACGFGDVVVELVHSSQALPSDTQTRFFAIAILDGAPPPSFREALASRILDREAEFKWVDSPGGEGRAAVAW